MILMGAFLGVPGCDGPDQAVVPAEDAPVDIGAAGDWGPGEDAADDSDIEGDSGSGGADDEPEPGPADELPEACEAPAFHEPCDAESDDPFAAVGLGCDADPNASIPISATYFDSPDSRAWAVASRFGGLDENGEPHWGRAKAMRCWCSAPEFSPKSGRIARCGSPRARASPAPTTATPACRAICRPR